jgi:putative MATE family efflux protein
MLSMVMASLVSLIDIAMIGRLGTEALAAVGYATQYLWLAQSVLFAIGIACVALMARAIGAGDPARARSALGASIVLSVGAAIVVCGLVIAIPVPLLAVLDAPEEVIALTVPYMRLTLGSAVLFAVAIVIESGFRAAKDTRTPMWIAGVITIIKTGLNVLLIFGVLGFPRLELIGAGIATVISQAVAVVMFVYASRVHRSREVLRLERRDASGAARLVGEVIRYFGLLGRYGAGAIAAYTVGVRILAFSWIPGIGFSTAASTLVGQALGARDPWGASRAGWRAARFALVVSAVLGGLYALSRNPLARLFTDDPNVIQELGPFMLMLALSQPFMGVHFTLGGALRGAGDTVTPLWAAALGNWGFRVPLAFAASRLLHLDVIWLWLALMLDHAARAVWMTWAFRAGRWARSGPENLRA